MAHQFSSATEEQRADHFSEVADTMLAVSGELEAMAHTCTEIQWLISSLLESAHHPDLSGELHMLQDIDRLQQTLFDISALVKVVAHPTRGISIPTSDIADSLKLNSLRTRLLGQGATPSPNGEQEDESTEITWL